jgi:hypothetical protein
MNNDEVYLSKMLRGENMGISLYEKYLRKLKIDEEIIIIHKLLYEDTVRIYHEYEKVKDKENIKKRIEFLESELTDLKKRIH